MKINKGDTIEITNPGNTYSEYSSKFKELGFKNKESNNSFQEGETAIVFNIGSHANGHTILLACRNSNGKECLISTEGVKLIKISNYEIY